MENDYHKNNENVQYIIHVRGFLIRSGMSFQVDHFLRARAPGETNYVFRMYVLKGGGRNQVSHSLNLLTCKIRSELSLKKSNQS